MTENNRVFALQSYNRTDRDFQYVVVLPEGSNDGPTEVQAAWSYAIRYTAKGLDLPDHEAAVRLLKERHPSWTVIPGSCATITIDLSKADNDQPER